MKIVSWIDEKYINWKGLVHNTCPQAIQFLRENPDKINWEELSSNSSPEAIQLLRENPDKINWSGLHMSSLEALMLLLEHPEQIDKVDTFPLFQNHHIFDDDVVIK